METKIVIVVPYTTESKEYIDKLRLLLDVRAGVDVTVYTVEDRYREGWIKLHNRLCKELDYDWYIYCPCDYFPGRCFVRIALEIAKRDNKLMVGFNDGKWFGKNATAGMVHKDLIKLVYRDTIFYPGYQHHGADPDLTEKAILMNEFVYAPEAILVEIDYTKDFEQRTNPNDMDLFIRRRANKFN
jgi:hypothetical protein